MNSNRKLVKAVLTKILTSSKYRASKITFLEDRADAYGKYDPNRDPVSKEGIDLGRTRSEYDGEMLASLGLGSIKTPVFRYYVFGIEFGLRQLKEDKSKLSPLDAVYAPLAELGSFVKKAIENSWQDGGYIYPTHVMISCNADSSVVFGGTYRVYELTREQLERLKGVIMSEFADRCSSRRRRTA